jgi:hypothetical protein
VFSFLIPVPTEAPRGVRRSSFISESSSFCVLLVLREVELAASSHASPKWHRGCDRAFCLYTMCGVDVAEGNERLLAIKLALPPSRPYSTRECT